MVKSGHSAFYAYKPLLTDLSKKLNYTGIRVLRGLKFFVCSRPAPADF